MTELESKVSERFRTFRRKRRLSQSQLARSVGCSTELVSRIERGRCLPSVKSLVAFASALEITPNELLGFGQEEPEVESPPHRGPFTNGAVHPDPGLR